MQDPKPLEQLKQFSDALHMVMKALPREALDELTRQGYSMKARKSLLWRLYLLHHAIDRASRKVLPTEEDKKAGKAFRDAKHGNH
jgi:hypothetical protein